MNKTSLRTSLIKWLLIFAIVPLTLVVGANLFLLSNDYENRALEKMHSSLFLKKKFIENWFDYRKMDIQSKADDSLIIEFMRALNKAVLKSESGANQFVNSTTWNQVSQTYRPSINHFMHDYDYIYDVFLISNTGDIVFSLAEEADLATNLVNGPYSKTQFSQAFIKAKETSKLAFSGIESYQPSFGVKAGFLITPIFDENRNILGFLPFNFA